MTPENEKEHAEQVILDKAIPEKTLDDCKTTTEIENYRVEKIKELQDIRDKRNLIKQEKLQTQLEIINLQSKKKNLEIAEDKANNLIAELNTIIELCKIKYWTVKN